MAGKLTEWREKGQSHRAIREKEKKAADWKPVNGQPLTVNLLSAQSDKRKREESCGLEACQRSTANGQPAIRTER
ncbi:MAG: hypothetical protein JNM88_04545 [Chitinophagaceae bacterium]|nr:hypothetical protein [Chitinophagaceae bacterium]